MEFRAYNQPWLNATRYYLEYMRDYLQPHLPKNGGGVILGQVENEYSQSNPPSQYIVWLAALAVEMNQAMGIVFYINNQQWAPLSVLAARDSYVPVEVNYINGTARARKQPALVVESYTGSAAQPDSAEEQCTAVLRLLHVARDAHCGSSSPCACEQVVRSRSAAHYRVGGVARTVC